MKRLLYILTVLVLFTNSSCKKFLAESSQDEVKPGNLSDLTSLMSGDGYPYQTNLSFVINYITDDISCQGGQGQERYIPIVKKIKSAFGWNKTMSEDLILTGGITSVSSINSWQILYKQIAGCNVILEYISKVSGPETEKQNLRGQALAMRAYYYFILVNMYARPYNDPASNPETNPGVPLKLDMSVSDQFYARNTVAEVYAQMEKDFLEAALLMRNNPKNNGIYKMSEQAAYAMLSRVYLYEEQWDKTIEYADKALAIKSNLAQLSSFTAAGGIYAWNNTFTNTNLNRIYDPAKSNEIIWAYEPNLAADKEVFVSSLSPAVSVVLDPPYSPSAELMNLYETRPVKDNEFYLADLRARLYYEGIFLSFIPNPPGLPIPNFKVYCGSKGGGGLRIAELYLNRAEANIRKALTAGGAGFPAALNDLNKLRASRYDTRQPYIPVNITDGAALLDFYKDERRRELAFEGHRWFDLRRYGMPAISHHYEEIPGSGEIFTLEKGDSRYTLQIPVVVMKRNPLLVQNQ
ncbi:RagB/SusD family nutrient uptake outer membrane protein [Pedobacter gandavensis]|uniref:RagB/SusD family nutrient uptake outer membrane protein n=1 Tax=Pedobacter gandavensis TaxID=2679963 RepID=UPI00292D4F40|nr:RagB/SusD family nutrient uptake outer membrane protein [Pedobacter gandavensis]